MKAPFIIRFLFHDWSLLLWSFHIRYIVTCNTSCIFSLLSLFHCFSQIATNTLIISETSGILLLLKGLPSNATKKLLVKTVEHKLEETFF